MTIILILMLTAVLHKVYGWRFSALPWKKDEPFKRKFRMVYNVLLTEGAWNIQVQDVVIATKTSVELLSMEVLDRSLSDLLAKGGIRRADLINVFELQCTEKD